MIKQFVTHQTCLECRGCCRFSQENSVWQPYLLSEEVKDLLNRNIPPSVISSDKRIRLIPEPGQNAFICAFLNTQDNKCKIYSFHPFECQLYPFLINRKGAEAFLAVDLKCPFIEKHFQDQGCKEYVRYLTGFLNSPRMLDVLKNNPQVIQQYEEASNLVKLKTLIHEIQ
jgi:Fe-S-cluster containining protein